MNTKPEKEAMLRQLLALLPPDPMPDLEHGLRRLTLREITAVDDAVRLLLRRLALGEDRAGSPRDGKEVAR